jgi:hypothetical protein
MNNPTTNDGGPAFPQDLQGRRGDDPQYQGMTLRDYFAGQALQAVAHNPHDYFTGEQSMSIYCYRMADAMIKAREERR